MDYNDYIDNSDDDHSYDVEDDDEFYDLVVFGYHILGVIPMDYNDYIDNSDDDYSYDVENDEHDDDYVDNKKSDLFLCVPNKKKIFFF